MPTHDGDGALASNGAKPCSICGGVGWLREDVPVSHPRFGKIVKCSCKERDELTKRRNDMLKRSNLGIYAEKTFETFLPHLSPSLTEAYNSAKKYASNPSGWFVLSGPVGCGKTHLAAAIAHEALEREMAVLFTTVPELMDYLRETFAPTNEMPYHRLFDDIREVSLLVLDDFGVGHTTPWVGEKLFQLVNHRYNNRTPTVFTLNPASLKNLDLRIVSRLSDIALVTTCRITAPDYRPRNASPKPLQRPSSEGGLS